MTDRARRAETREFFEERYARERLHASRNVLENVVGEEVGLNGYTTPDQADALVSHLRLGPESLVLDLGAGRGWPGSRLARRSGCRVVLSDLPMDALRESFHYASERGVGDRAWPVRADGLCLPFADASFHAVSHADVFC